MANFTVTANIESAKPSSSRSAIHSIMVENYRKSLIQHCERSELRLHYEFKRPKMVRFEGFLKAVLPDRSVLIGQNLM